jgi:hypothetical protein
VTRKRKKIEGLQEIVLGFLTVILGLGLAVEFDAIFPAALTGVGAWMVALGGYAQALDRKEKRAVQRYWQLHMPGTAIRWKSPVGELRRGIVQSIDYVEGMEQHRLEVRNNDGIAYQIWEHQVQ